MLLRLNATVFLEGNQIIPRLGNPEDHQLEGDFIGHTSAISGLGIEVVVWCESPLHADEVDEVADWVLQNLGWGNGE